MIVFCVGTFKKEPVLVYSADSFLHFLSRHGEFSFQVQDGQAEFRSSSAKHSCAVFQPGTFPGRLFIRYIPFLNKSR